MALLSASASKVAKRCKTTIVLINAGRLRPAALRGIALLHQHQVEFNLLVVVHNEIAAHAAAIYDRVVTLGARYLQFQPLMSEGAALRKGYQLSADNWGVLWSVSGASGKSAAIWGGYSSSISNRRGRNTLPIPAAAAHSARCGSNLVMESDGQLYACDHLINAEHRLGRLDEQTLAAAVDASVQLPFGQQKACAANVRLAP